MKSQNESLQHAGLLGMKWHVRRWRNPDGTLTDAGKERYNYYKKKRTSDYLDSDEKAFYTRLDNSSGKSVFTKEIESYGSSVNQVGKILDAFNVGVRTKSLAGKTDRELKEAIERAKLEADYKKYFPTQYKTDTRKKVDAVLEAASGVINIGSTVSDIYSTIMTAQKKNIDARIAADNLKEANAFVNNYKNVKYEDFIKMDSEVLKLTTNRLTELNNLKKAVENATRTNDGKVSNQDLSEILRRLDELENN